MISVFLVKTIVCNTLRCCIRKVNGKNVIEKKAGNFLYLTYWAKFRIAPNLFVN